jgi:nucleoside-diphosphate-sugar epimerase
MMKILITGINGFVGTNMYNHFKKKLEIVGIDIPGAQKKKQCRILSWQELNSIPDVKTIIHLAGKAHDTSNRDDDSEYFNINVGLTKNIYEFFLNSSAEKFIFFSSVKAAADSVLGDCLTESEMPRPSTPYGVSKLEAEKYLLSESLPKTKKLYIVRPAMIHGPGNKGNLNLLHTFAKKGIPFPLGSYANNRSFMSIDNMLYILEKIIMDDITPGVYNVCDDDPLSTIEIISMMYKSLEKKPKILSIPKPVVQSIARLGDCIPLPINSERLKKMTESYVVSNYKIKSALRIKELPFSSRSGMMRTIASFN